MKNFFIAAVVATLFSMFQPQEAQARIKIGYSTGPTTESIHKFEEPIVVDYKNYGDLGVIFEQFSIMGIPIWNYGVDPTYVLYNEYNLSISYLELSTEDIHELCEVYDIEVDSEPSLSFWNKFGGKLIILLIIIAVVAYYALKSDDDDDKK